MTLLQTQPVTEVVKEIHTFGCDYPSCPRTDIVETAEMAVPSPPPGWEERRQQRTIEVGTTVTHYCDWHRDTMTPEEREALVLALEDSTNHRKYTPLEEKLLERLREGKDPEPRGVTRLPTSPPETAA